MDDNPIAQLRAIYRGLLELQRLLVLAPGGPVFHVKFSAYEQYQDLVERANKIEPNLLTPFYPGETDLVDVDRGTTSYYQAYQAQPILASIEFNIGNRSPTLHYTGVE